MNAQMTEAERIASRKNTQEQVNYLEEYEAQVRGEAERDADGWYEGKTATLKDGSELAAKYPGEVALYDVYLREAALGHDFQIVQDNCAGYQNLINRMGLPPTYKTPAK